MIEVRMTKRAHDLVETTDVQSRKKQKVFSRASEIFSSQKFAQELKKLESPDPLNPLYFLKGDDLVLMSIEDDIDIKKINEILKENKELHQKPILFKQGDKFSIYGFSPGEGWRLTQDLNPDPLKKLEFDEKLKKPKILRNDEIPEKVRQEITFKKGCLIGEHRPYVNYPVYKEIFEGDVDGVRKLLESPQPPFIHRSPLSGGAPLFMAVALSLPITDLLLKNHADPTRLNFESFSPLVYVMLGGQPAILDKLFAHSPRLLASLNLKSWVYLIKWGLDFGHSDLLIHLGKKMIKKRDRHSLQIYIILLSALGLGSLQDLINENKIIEVLEDEAVLRHFIHSNNQIFLSNLFENSEILDALKKPANSDHLVRLTCELENETTFQLILSRCPGILENRSKTGLPNFTTLISLGRASFSKDYITKSPQTLAVRNNYRSAVLIAAETGQEEMLSFLLLFYKKCLGKFFTWPLDAIYYIALRAIQAGHCHIIQFLHREGKFLHTEGKLDSNALRDDKGNNLMHRACRLSDAAILDCVNQIDPGLRDEANEDGYPPFYIAITGDNLEAFKWYLKKSDQMKKWIKSDSKNNIVHYASRKGAVKILEHLFKEDESDSDEKKMQKNPLFFARNHNDETPLACAVFDQQIKVIDFFHKKCPSAFTEKVKGLNLFEYMTGYRKAPSMKKKEIKIGVLNFFHTHYPEYFKRLGIALSMGKKDRRFETSVFSAIPANCLLYKSSCGTQITVSWHDRIGVGRHDLSADRDIKRALDKVDFPTYPSILSGEQVPWSVYHVMAPYLKKISPYFDEKNLFNYATIFGISAWTRKAPNMPWHIDEASWDIIVNYVGVYFQLIKALQHACCFFPKSIMSEILSYAVDHSCEKIVSLLVPKCEQESQGGKKTGVTGDQKAEPLPVSLSASYLSDTFKNLITRISHCNPEITQSLILTREESLTRQKPQVTEGSPDRTAEALAKVGINTQRQAHPPFYAVKNSLSYPA
jgi:hypothetical protein